MRSIFKPGIEYLVVLTAVLAMLGCPPAEEQAQPLEEPDQEQPAEEADQEEPAEEQEQPDGEEQETGEAAEGEQAAEDETVIEMQGYSFVPQEVTVTPGTTVRWVNRSDVVHTVTADPERASDSDNVELPEGMDAFHSGDIPPGEEYSKELTEPGTYRYICVPHEQRNMVGTITVREEED